jgi:hypothetical protein
MMVSLLLSILEFPALIFDQSLIFFLFPHKNGTSFWHHSEDVWGHGCTAPYIPKTTTK